MAKNCYLDYENGYLVCRVVHTKASCVADTTTRSSSDIAAKQAYRPTNRTPEYGAWRSMKNRCSNKNYSYYHRYGGRGIKVCERWLDSFSNFLEDVGHKPSPEVSLDRINNDADYEPGNCRWATPTQQVMNRTLLRENKTGHHNIFPISIPEGTRRKKKYSVSFMRNRKYIHVGDFETLENAVSARDKWLEKDKSKKIMNTLTRYCYCPNCPEQSHTEEV